MPKSSCFFVEFVSLFHQRDDAKPQMDEIMTLSGDLTG